MRPGSAASGGGEQPRTLTELTKIEGGGGGKMTPWRPQQAWRPAGPTDATRLPYSQPWYRQGQGALDQVVKELREMRSLVETRTTERDHALNMAQEANQMWASIKEENTRLEVAKRDADEAAEAEKAAAEAARMDAHRARGECDRLEREKGNLLVEVEKAHEATTAAEGEAAAAKKALAVMASRKADEQAQARRAEAELAAATELANRMEAQRAAEMAAAQHAEVARLQSEHEGELAAAADEEARRLRAIRAVVVPDDTRDMIEKQLSKPSQPSARSAGKGAAVAELGEAAFQTRYQDPEEIFSLLEGGASGHGPQVTLIRASWLRAKQPRFLPAAKADLPPEALIYASELRKIYRQTKTKQKLLPIISVLHPFSAPMTSNQHPDEDGTILGRVIEALDMRWDQFTRKRGTGSDSGVADLGVFFDWCALEEPSFGKPRTATDVEDFGLWYAPTPPHRPALLSPCLLLSHSTLPLGHTRGRYAHQLLTVWMIPEARDAETNRLTFSNGWSAFEYLMGTVFKPTSDLSGYNGAWPQLLDLSEDFDFEHNERIHRPPPAEPLVFVKGHELGDCVFADEGERKIASNLYQAALFETLAGSTELIFSKLGWGDVEVARLALVLPLCANLVTLKLDCNAIGDKGIVALAEALSSLEVLEVLNLSGNVIGDPGASRLSGALTDGALQASLKNLGLNDNSLGDKGALNLASAISGGAIPNCKAVGLKGNPASAMARKGVAKALKKAKSMANAAEKK